MLKKFTKQFVASATIDEILENEKFHYQVNNMIQLLQFYQMMDIKLLN